ncbi:DUF5659 domain-containing protein [Priestia flexa]|uniref:DUF5659 domain-containing protein n=1 Tax=Priestia flexa TaxID=86664 RepID=UPI00240D0DA5|nr:DUF5659 domain-containing protein [Priestia flexa]WEZ08131.1 DUF5659 domain-containing protein [Priestia flexa]
MNVSLKRIFEPEVADYLFKNGATLKRISRDQKRKDATIFHFEQNEKLNELLKQRNKR